MSAGPATRNWVIASLTVVIALLSRFATAQSLARFEPLRGAYLGVVLKDGGSAADVAAFSLKAGKAHAVYTTFVDFQEGFPGAWVGMIKSNSPGSAVHITLEPVTGFTNFFAANWGPGQETYQAALAFATNCAAAGLPIFLRFAHEANGFWYPWCPSYSDSDTISNDTYIAAWRNFANLIHSNAPNVAMVWAPNQGNGGGELPFYTHTYPGDDCVDWVGMSLYNGSWYGNGDDVMDYEFRDAIQKGYWQSNGDTTDDTEVDFYWTFSDPDNPGGHCKPMMIAETSAQFVPQFSASSTVGIAAFDSLTGATVTVLNDIPLDAFEAATNWNWGPWGNMYFSNTADRVQGTNAVVLSATADFNSGSYVGGNGRDVLPATDWSSFNGMTLWAKRSSSAEGDPQVRIGVRSGYGAGCGTANVDVVVSSTNYSLMQIYFSSMTLGSGFTWTNVSACTLELSTTNSGQRPADMYLDDWRLANLTNEPDQSWWPPWGLTAWTQTTDAAVGTYALRVVGTDDNGDYYIGGSGCSLAVPEQNWTNSNAVILYVKRGPGAANARPDPKFRLTLDSDSTDANGTEAFVDTQVGNTNYTEIIIPFQDFAADTGFSWAVIQRMKVELSTSSGPDSYDLYLDELGRVSVALTNGADNLRWKSDWMDQVYSLSDYSGSDHPKRVDISKSFRNIHLINWFDIRKFEDGETKDFQIPDFGGSSPAFSSYYARVSNDYFLTNMVVDLNGDGIDDAWQDRFFSSYTSTNAMPTADPDSDGQNNWDEFIAGTDPTNASSTLRFNADSSVDSLNGIVVRWSSETGRVYTIDKSTNLPAGFSGLATNLPATPTINSYTDAVVGSGPWIYRVRVVP